MDKEVTITLPANDLGQILDGLHARHAEWQLTADAFDDDGNFIGVDDDSLVMLECSGKAEAQSIADTYKRIIGSIESQTEAETPVYVRSDCGRDDCDSIACVRHGAANG